MVVRRRTRRVIWAGIWLAAALAMFAYLRWPAWPVWRVRDLGFPLLFFTIGQGYERATAASRLRREGSRP